VVQLLQVPYDSGHRSARMGLGPEHLVEHGAAARLHQAGHEVHTAVVEPASAWRAEIRTVLSIQVLHQQTMRQCQVVCILKN